MEVSELQFLRSRWETVRVNNKKQEMPIFGVKARLCTDYFADLKSASQTIYSEH